MSFSERIDAAKQTYRNYLDAHPNSRLKTLKAFSKAVSSFCTRKVIVWEATKRLQPNEENAFLPELNKALKERNSSSHSSIDPKLSSEVVVQPAPSPEVATACADALRCIKEPGQDLSRFWGLLEQCRIVELSSLAQAAKETLENSAARTQEKDQLTSPYLETINKQLIKRRLVHYINKHQAGLFRKPGNKALCERAMKNIARMPLKKEELNNPDLLSSLFKALVKSDPPFSEQLSNEMVRAVELYENGKKKQAEQLVEKTRIQAEPPAAQKAWFNDTLYLMQLAYQEAPDTGEGERTSKSMLCNFFVDSLLQLPESKSLEKSIDPLIILAEQAKLRAKAASALSILFSKKD